MVNKKEKKNSENVSIVNNADSDASVLVSGVEEVKKNLRFVERILNKFGDKIKFETKPTGEYLFTFVDNDEAMVEVMKILDEIVIMLPIRYGGWKIKYNDDLLDRLIKKKKNEYIVILDRGDELKVDIMTSEDIMVEVSIGLVAIKSEGVILLTDRCECE
jgi:hypothetical protein